MSQTEQQIEECLTQIEKDLAEVTESLQPILNCECIDDLARQETQDRTRIPYVLSAYALSSTLFAYLRSEGQDVSQLMPILGRVKAKMDELSAKADESSNNDDDRIDDETWDSKTKEVQPKIRKVRRKEKKRKEKEAQQETQTTKLKNMHLNKKRSHGNSRKKMRREPKTSK